VWRSTPRSAPGRVRARRTISSAGRRRQGGGRPVQGPGKALLPAFHRDAAAAGTLETVAEESARRDARAPRGDHDLTAVLSRVSLWVERIVVLSDRVMNLSETYGVSMTTLPDPADTAIRARDTAPAAPAEERAAYERESVPEPQESVLASVTDSPDAPVSEDSEEFGFQTLDRARSIFNEEQPASEPAGASCAPGWADERGENAEETETVAGLNARVTRRVRAIPEREATEACSRP